MNNRGDMSMARELQAQFSGGGGDGVGSRSGRKGRSRRGRGQNRGGYAYDIGPSYQATTYSSRTFQTPMSSHQPANRPNPDVRVPRNPNVQPAYYGSLVESNSPDAIDFAPRPTTSVSTGQPAPAPNTNPSQLAATGNKRKFNVFGAEPLRPEHTENRPIARPAARPVSPMDTSEDYRPIHPSSYLTQREKEPQEKKDNGSERHFPLGTGTTGIPKGGGLAASRWAN